MPSTLGPDIVVHRPEGPFVAAIEVKNREGLTPEIATQLRRNLLVHGASPRVPFFLLLSQEKGFLWKESEFPDFDARPDAEFSMTDVIRRFAPTDFTDRLRGSELETVVFLWLATLAEMDEPVETEPEATLSRVGFVKAVQGASLSREAA
jgi:hypothetical protein